MLWFSLEPEIQMMFPPYHTQQSALISGILREPCSVQIIQNLLKWLIQVFGVLYCSTYYQQFLNMQIAAAILQAYKDSYADYSNE